MSSRSFARWAAALAVAALVFVSAAPPAAALPSADAQHAILSALWSKVTAWLTGVERVSSGFSWSRPATLGTPGVTEKHGHETDPNGTPGEEADSDPEVTEKHGHEWDPSG